MADQRADMARSSRDPEGLASLDFCHISWKLEDEEDEEAAG